MKEFFQLLLFLLIVITGCSGLIIGANFDQNQRSLEAK